MSRLVIVPQLPQKLRYQEFFFYEFPNKLKNYFDDIILIGKDYLYFHPQGLRDDISMFSSINESIEFELYQIKEYNSLDLKNDDILLMLDLSFPGFFSNILYHKKPNKCFVYCHATSKNQYDLFSSVRYSKFPCETAHSKLYNKVFVGSEYHKNKLGWNNIEVVGLPVPPFETFKEEKIYDIISVSRPNKQKVNKKIEKLIERDFCDIIRKDVNSWEEYYKFLSQGKILLLTGKEETFGYSAMESIMNNTYVLAPRNFSYPELLPNDYLYSNYEELKLKIWNILNDKEYFPISKLINQDLCDNFYKNISERMKG